jgi:hypothetical protein
MRHGFLIAILLFLPRLSQSATWEDISPGTFTGWALTRVSILHGELLVSGYKMSQTEDDPLFYGHKSFRRRLGETGPWETHESYSYHSVPMGQGYAEAAGRGRYFLADSLMLSSSGQGNPWNTVAIPTGVMRVGGMACGSGYCASVGVSHQRAYSMLVCPVDGACEERGLGALGEEPLPWPDTSRATKPLELLAASGDSLWAISDSLYISPDRGSTWTKRPSPGYRFILPHASGLLMAAPLSTETGPGLWRSRDGGLTAQKVSTQGLSGKVWELAARPGEIFAATDSGVFVSSDAAAHWRSLTMGMKVDYFGSLSVEGNILVATFGQSVMALKLESTAIRDGAFRGPSPQSGSLRLPGRYRDYRGLLRSLDGRAVPR